MAAVTEVTGTAFVVAEFRAEENSQPAPLYRDPIVGLFLSEESRAAANRVAMSFPQVTNMVRLRTRYIDDTLDERLRSHVRQVVILGAGLDTRAVRKPAAGVTYFEIDDAATLDLKRMRYAERGIDARVRFIPGNYVTDGVIDLLAGAGFDFGVPTYCVWEGNTMYLTSSAIRDTLAELARHVRHFRLSFDYLAETVISKTTGDRAITSLVESFANMGAPWLSGIRDVRGLARELGLVLVDNVRTSELHRRYWAGRPIASPIFDFYSLCTLGTDERLATAPARL